ncbi:MAG: pilin protein [Idiomarinaceae bacterium HL-53]|nr:MAG: pilin protein [Idiomarinaceae bacterium HL-53]CUS47177.1 prepilin-type N-terminal cleavage/methylation domain-containing protein [Idiomarinaceae bacterium HL-53]
MNIAKKRGIAGFTLPEVMLAMTLGVTGALMLETAMRQWFAWELLERQQRATLELSEEAKATWHRIDWSKAPPQCTP